MRLCWNAIVKNEGERILRAAASVAPYITSWVIVDTGSTDDTKQKVQDFFQEKGIPGEFHDEPFEDWSQARNAALSWARRQRYAYPWDYLLLMDADMELVIKDDAQFQRMMCPPAMDMYQVAGPTHYQNRRLISSGATGLYRGVTHEYLDVPSAGLIGEDVAYFVDHTDGANRPEKFKRDIRLLKAGLKQEPNNERYFYYLAGSYRDAGDHRNAAKWFKRRVDAGGWDEERWSAQVNYAHALHALGDEGAFVRELLVAYSMRPSRAEPMYDLAHHYRNKDNMQPAALAFAEAVEHLPPSKDALFVNDFVYRAGIKEEISICSFYVPEKREKGFKVTDHLSLQPGPYWWSRELARSNIYHYVSPLLKFCPSFQWKDIGFNLTEPGWTPMNPSITAPLNANMICNVRFVNYRIDDRGAYLIRGTDGTVNRENPIRTRNFLVKIKGDLSVDLSVSPPAVELLPPGNLPCEFPLVVGFEDVRLFPHEDELWSSATVRQIHPDGNCEQVLSRLQLCITPERHYRHMDVKRMLREPRETEKNWAPICGLPTKNWMWRPGTVVNETGEFVYKHDTGLATGHISGGSQLIPFRKGWLSVVHEARPLPGESYKRYYYHRFALYDQDFKLAKLSPPFVFHDRTIEFCAGMCWNPNVDYRTELVLSYGVKDECARVARIKDDEVERFLWLHL
jgi:glycosyltransferase involved in cell wall biosynthesis